MSWKKLGASDLSATTNTSVYTVPASTEAIVAVNVCNRNASAVAIRLAVAESGTPGNEDYIEYDVSVPANGVLERTGLHMEATKVLVAYSDTANVSVLAHGNERSTA